MNMNSQQLLQYLQKPDSFFLLAGPCVVESADNARRIASELKGICQRLEIPFVFKASYRKANRSRIDSFTGIGDEAALDILAGIKSDFDLPIVTDIHLPEEAAMAARVADILQIPAFLCRQTDILIAAAETGKVVNIKKGQFLSGASMKFAVDKVQQSGNPHVMLTERGSMFGYQDLVVDYRNIADMSAIGVPVVLDVTHSLQQPNQSSGVTGGKPELIGLLAKAGIACGAHGIFIETHPEPSKALSDGANMLRLDLIEPLLSTLMKIRKAL
jgi:2-dehydro-3-deoxyphosphooctonate aldolase (KDO 8-P synthase)